MRPKVVLFGDSITEESFGDGGWGASLADLLRRKADMVLRGYSGYNTRWALKVMERVFPAAGDGGAYPSAVTVFFGANDACLPARCSGFQHVPLLEYKQNLRLIVSFLKNRWPRTVIILITPPPIDEEARLRYPYIENTIGLPERTNEAAGTYAKACVAVANECQIPAIDLWSKMQQIPNWQTECLWDGLHLSRVGNKVVFEEVTNTLKGEGIGAEDLVVDLPLIEDVDPKKPLTAFDDQDQNAVVTRSGPKTSPILGLKETKPTPAAHSCRLSPMAPKTEDKNRAASDCTVKSKETSDVTLANSFAVQDSYCAV
ncbi:unnamed protein product [Brassica rapa]|uniref:SGNH hydrolase-type esterase domain-containing protein n=1 Tax=Brassica campestris TaxID=3711 RepID=A0A3P6D2J1_BRACM|nr:unnamed protein product [Brassica rapa]VDD13779.1 unnamed protein product [Brassica rapa]